MASATTIKFGDNLDVTDEGAGVIRVDGGGGSLPDWWTVDSTPGTESVTFNGAVTIVPSGAVALSIAGFTIYADGGVVTPGFQISGAGDSIAFFGVTPAEQPVHPVTLQDVIDALTALGLVAA